MADSYRKRYEDAKEAVETNPCKETYLEAARAALEVYDHRSSDQLRWVIADVAAIFARKAGLDTEPSLGHARRPNVDKLRTLLEE